MTCVVMGFVLLSAAVLQVTVPPHALLGQAKCPFLLSVVVYYSLTRDGRVMLTAAVAAGFLQDALSPIPLGYSACCFALAGWLCGRFRHTVLTDSVVTQVFFGVVSGVAVTLCIYLLLLRADLLAVPFRWALLKAAGSGTLGAVCVPAVFMVTGRLDRLVGNVASVRDVEEYVGEFNGSI